MGRFDRFKKLERARPDGPDDAQAQSSMRFEKIEARKDPPAPAAPDPFAPPPEDADLPLEIAHDDNRDIERAKQERLARAQKKIDEERQRIAEMQMRAEAAGDPLHQALEKGGILNLTNTQKVYGMVGLLGVIAVLAVLVSPVMWGLAPIVLIIGLASMFTQR